MESQDTHHFAGVVQHLWSCHWWLLDQIVKTPGLARVCQGRIEIHHDGELMSYPFSTRWVTTIRIQNVTTDARSRSSIPFNPASLAPKWGGWHGYCPIVFVKRWNRRNLPLLVRRAFLCGWDALTQRDYEHRKVWTSQRLQELAGIFTIDVCGYAAMANHLHVILRNRPDLAAQASDRDIALRWWRLFPKRRTFDHKPEEPTDLELDMVLEGQGRLDVLRKRLCSVSWFMRCLKENLAKRANAEDQCTGRFWEGRFGASLCSISPPF